MKRRKWSYLMKWCIVHDKSISSHSLGLWTTMSKSYQLITIVSTSAITIACWLPLHLRSMGDALRKEFWNECRNCLNTPISIMTTSCWHQWQLGMHLSMMQRSGCCSIATWQTSVSRHWRNCCQWRMLYKWLDWVIARAALSAISLERPCLPSHPMQMSFCS